MMETEIDKLIEELRIPGPQVLVEKRLETLQAMHSINPAKVTHGIFVGILCYFSANQKENVLELPESLVNFLTFAHKKSARIAKEKKPAGIDHLVVGYSHLLKLLATSNINLKGIHGTRAKNSFNKAMADQEVRSEAKLMDACMLWNTPVRHGGDKEKALKILHELKEDSTLDRVASNIFHNYKKSAHTYQSSGNQAYLRSTDGRGKYSIRRLVKKITRNFELDIKDLEFQEATLTAVVGRNGAGKSSLLASLLSIDSPDIMDFQYLHDKPVSKWTEKTISLKNLGFQLTSVRNVPDIKILEIVRLHKILYKFQDSTVLVSLGIENLLEKSVSQLSSGEVKRVEIFFALAHWPNIIVLDEPTATVDHMYCNEIYRLTELATNEHQCTIICATHDMQLIALSHQVSVISGGKLISNFNRESIVQKYGQSVLLKEKHLGKNIQNKNGSNDAMVIVPKEDLLKHLEKFSTSINNDIEIVTDPYRIFFEMDLKSGVV